MLTNKKTLCLVAMTFQNLSMMLKHFYQQKRHKGNCVTHSDYLLGGANTLELTSITVSLFSLQLTKLAMVVITIDRSSTPTTAEYRYFQFCPKSNVSIFDQIRTIDNVKMVLVEFREYVIMKFVSHLRKFIMIYLCGFYVCSSTFAISKFFIQLWMHTI